MNTQEKAALESLIAKLNSLRKTLSDEEREILDSMVITDYGAEVTLHRQVPRNEPVYEPKQQPKSVPAVDDDEVSLHRQVPAADPKVTTTATPKAEPIIIFDPETETYKVVGRAID